MLTRGFPEFSTLLRRLVMAITIGVVAALVVWLFRVAMFNLERLLLNNDSGSLVQAAQALAPWRRALTPALGGLVAGLILWGWQRSARQGSHAPTDYMEAIETGDGRLDTIASLVKSSASLVVVASGSAIGREGAMILLATVAASLIARAVSKSDEWKLWVACGAAAGMASAYHAPLAGSLFIAEILFGSLLLASLGPVLVAAVSALLLTQWLTGSPHPLYSVTPVAPPSLLQYAFMALTGLLAGLSGPLFLQLLAISSRGFRALRLPPPLQLGLGGLIVGGLSLVMPQVWGNGYSVVQSFLTLPPPVWVVAGILVCKLIAVLASCGSGAPGGVFTPTLFVGAAIGLIAGQCAQLTAGDSTAILLALTGMGAFLAATTHAPIMSALMVCEMTGEFGLLPGILLASVLGSVLSRWLHPNSIYRQRSV
ncbi:voltage-gated ClC-type chloride channel ClcB [Shimwellia pseudoproteus]|uniref:voltage-gated ClC-type chloride channel ClcB n=1 Tax=Shimwellia pseudoproteus TaxID=570012 RepID=UPI0018ECBE4B|nr:voltage-gated ClC-type chloride channel ClcB [Shimwellia pseudoproteus]MBJ3816180.1 voltage-gated ClC-type chloride channel ClcB [Shimwellia pseudoproteus]